MVEMDWLVRRPVAVVSAAFVVGAISETLAPEKSFVPVALFLFSLLALICAFFPSHPFALLSNPFRFRDRLFGHTVEIATNSSKPQPTFQRRHRLFTFTNRQRLSGDSAGRGRFRDVDFQFRQANKMANWGCGAGGKVLGKSVKSASPQVPTHLLGRKG